MQRCGGRLIVRRSVDERLNAITRALCAALMPVVDCVMASAWLADWLAGGGGGDRERERARMKSDERERRLSLPPSCLV